MPGAITARGTIIEVQGTGAGGSKTVNAITNANPGVCTTSANHGFADGDVLTFATIASGMTQLSAKTVVILVLTATTFSMIDVDTGLAIDTTAYGTFSGTVAVTTVDREAACTRGFSTSGGQAEEIVVTDMCSTGKEILTGDPDFGTKDFSFFAKHADAGQKRLFRLYRAGTEVWFWITYSDGEVEVFKGIVTSFTTSAQTGGAVEGSCSVQLNGAPIQTWNVAA